MRIKGNSFFYRGIIKIVGSLIILAASLFFYFYLQSSELRYVFLIISLMFGVLPLATGIYFLIPFKKGSPWNGELRWKFTAFEYWMSIVIVYFVYITILDSQEGGYIWLGVGFILVTLMFYVLGRLSSKRSHGPVSKSWLDNFLESRGIY